MKVRVGTSAARLKEGVWALDIVGMGAAQIAQRIRDGQISSVEAVEEHIRRAERVEPQVNAIAVRRFEEAIDEAKHADALRASGASLGPLHGVPITIKECFDLEGTASTAGVQALSARIATVDAPTVSRLRRAGAIVLGKTNLSQLIWFNDSDNPLFGRTNNPWDISRGPGGSSGGPAAAVASGSSALDLGTDSGGSIRQPAHSCGVHGLKPTTGRLSSVGTVDSLILYGRDLVPNQPGPMARTVADLALSMKVLANPSMDSEDPSVPPVELRDIGSISVRGLRVGFFSELPDCRTSPAVRRAVNEAAEALTGLGAILEPFQPPHIAEAIRIHRAAFGGDGCATLLKLLGTSPRSHRMEDLFARKQRLPLSTNEYWQLVGDRTLYTTRFIAELNERGLDALICPPSAVPALPHDYSDDAIEAAQDFTKLFNVVGLPAGVIAATRVREHEESTATTASSVEPPSRAVDINSAGLPVGVQVAARLWREDVVLAVMAALEQHFSTSADYPLSIPPVVRNRDFAP